MSISKKIWNIAERWRVAAARLRSKWFLLYGASVGAKCLFYHGVRLDRPWTCSFGKRCVLEPGVWFDVVSDNASINVGEFTFFGRGAHLLVSDGVTIGDHCLIGDGVVISDHKHNADAGQRIGEQGCNSDRVYIGNDVLLCVRCVILQGVTIGDGAIVGPGAIVSQDVKPYSIVGTPPARMLGTRGSN